MFQHQVKPRKMHLWGPRGKLLGYIITKRDMEANPDKISAITEIGHVKNVKDVQWLMGASWPSTVSCPGWGNVGSPCTGC
jgi:hypothetical protein